MPINRSEIKNILVVRNDRFGEFLLNIPALRALKENFPESRITIVLDPYLEDFAGCISFIDEEIGWRRARHSLKERISLIRFLRSKKFDLAIMLNPSKEFNIITWFAGIPVRAGYKRKCAFLLTHKIIDNKHLGEKHEVEYNLELVGLVGAHTEDKSLRLNNERIVGDLPHDFKDIPQENLVAIHPWTSDKVKQWPLTNFQDLSKRIAVELNKKVIIVGSRDNLELSKEFFSENVVNLTGKTTLKELAAVLRKCRLLISGDSGPVHLASCLGTQVIALFRNDLHGKTAKRWGPWGKQHLVIEKNNLLSLTVEEVFNKVREVLKNK